MQNTDISVHIWFTPSFISHGTNYIQNVKLNELLT